MSTNVYLFSLQTYDITVGKQTPCKLSFVYTSSIRHGVRAAKKFGNFGQIHLILSLIDAHYKWPQKTKLIHTFRNS